MLITYFEKMTIGPILYVAYDHLLPLYWACLGWEFWVTVQTDISWKVTEFSITLEPWKTVTYVIFHFISVLWSLEVISKRGHRFCYQGYVPQVMGSALLSQIQSQAVDGIIATGCSTHTRTLSHRQETEKKAVATATKGLIKGLWSCVHTRLHLWA